MSFVDVQHGLQPMEIQLTLCLETKGYNIAVFSIPYKINPSVRLFELFQRSVLSLWRKKKFQETCKPL